MINTPKPPIRGFKVNPDAEAPNISQKDAVEELNKQTDNSIQGNQNLSGNGTDILSAVRKIKSVQNLSGLRGKLADVEAKMEHFEYVRSHGGLTTEAQNNYDSLFYEKSELRVSLGMGR
jgi:hypothetical protein